MARKKTILIFGISSFVGSNLAEFLKNDFRVVGTYYKTKVSIEGVLAVPCDVLSKDKVQLVLYSFKPDIVIYSVGLTSLVDCSEFNDYADALNTSGLFNVTDYAQRYKSQVVYLSSQYVFGGEGKVYQEMDIPDGNTIYGKTKASAEFFLQKSSLNYLIFRCCSLYGRGIHPGQETFFEKTERGFNKGMPLRFDNYVHSGYLDVSFLGMILKMVFDQDEKNRLFQVKSSNILTHYEFAKEYAKVFGFSNSTLSKTRWPLPILDLPRGVDSGNVILNYDMNVLNIEGSLNIEMPSVKESLEYTFKRFNGGKKNKERRPSGGVSFI